MQGIKMLVAVVILHAILWLPMTIFQLSVNLICSSKTTFNNFCNDGLLVRILYISSHFLTISNTALNPIIYGFSNQRFRVCLSFSLLRNVKQSTIRNSRVTFNSWDIVCFTGETHNRLRFVRKWQKSVTLCSLQDAMWMRDFPNISFKLPNGTENNDRSWSIEKKFVEFLCEYA